jgi:coenzyme F420-reducing hydrogenase delta subunit
MPATPIAQLRHELQNKMAALSGPSKIVVFSCRQAGNCAPLANAATAVVELECTAMLPPSFLEYALRMGAAGAVVAGCREADCEFRLGDQWVKERIRGTREPYLRTSVPRERIALSWSGRDMLDVAATIAALRVRVSTVDGMASPLKVEVLHD